MLTAVWNAETSVTKVFAEGAMNPMGLSGLYKLMLIHAKKEIATVLRICADARNYPIMIHCASG